MLDSALDPMELAEPNGVGQTHSTVQVAYLAVKGMQCESCGRRVRNALFALDGVLAVDILLAYQEASVTYDAHRATPDDLMLAVVQAGAAAEHPYTPQLLKVARAEDVVVI